VGHATIHGSVALEKKERIESSAQSKRGARKIHKASPDNLLVTVGIIR
jgi:hypothetical protein